MTLAPSPGRRGDPTWLPEVLRAFGVKVVEDPGWKLWGMGDFGSIWGVIAHHTGANNTSAAYIRRNPGLSNALSSQIHLSRDGVVTLVGAGIAWHAGRGSYPGLPTNDANRVTIGIEAQGDGQTWPDKQMDAYYRTCAAILWYLGLPASRVIAHHEYSYRAQGKWDPGLNGKRMPMDPFRARVQEYIDNPPHLQTQSKEQPLLFQQIADFIKGFVGPVISDVKDIRAQLTGGRDAGEFPGWPQLGQTSSGANLTLVDGVAAARRDITALTDKVDALIALMKEHKNG